MSCPASPLQTSMQSGDIARFPSPFSLPYETAVGGAEEETVTGRGDAALAGDDLQSLFTSPVGCPQCGSCAPLEHRLLSSSVVSSQCGNCELTVELPAASASLLPPAASASFSSLLFDAEYGRRSDSFLLFSAAESTSGSSPAQLPSPPPPPPVAASQPPLQTAAAAFWRVPQPHSLSKPHPSLHSLAAPASRPPLSSSSAVLDAGGQVAVQWPLLLSAERRVRSLQPAAPASSWLLLEERIHTAPALTALPAARSLPQLGPAQHLLPAAPVLAAAAAASAPSFPSPSLSAPSSSSVPDFPPSHYAALAELFVDELCGQTAQTSARYRSRCKAALRHCLQHGSSASAASALSDPLTALLRRCWLGREEEADAARLMRAQTAHMQALAAAVFGFVYQQQALTAAAAAPAAATAAASSFSPPSLPPAASPPPPPPLSLERLCGLCSASPDSSPLAVSVLSQYSAFVSSSLSVVDLEALVAGGASCAASVLLSHPLLVEACRPSFIEYANKFPSLLDAATVVLAVDILNAAVRLNLSHRRNHSSLSAAALFLAAALQGVRLTQHQYCAKIGLTEVTLRKVNRELGLHWRRLVPLGYTEKTLPPFLSRQQQQQRSRASEPQPAAAAAEQSSASTVPDAPPSPTVKQEEGQGEKEEKEEEKDRDAAARAAAVEAELSEQDGSISRQQQQLDHLPLHPPLPPPLSPPSHALTAAYRFQRSAASGRRQQPLQPARHPQPSSDSDTEQEDEEEDENRAEGEAEGQGRSREGEQQHRLHAVTDAEALPLFLPPYLPTFLRLHSVLTE